MPRRDGTGPQGRGSLTGRGMGFCTNNADNSAGPSNPTVKPGFAMRARGGRGIGLGGRGMGPGRGFGRGMGFGRGNM